MIEYVTQITAAIVGLLTGGGGVLTYYLSRKKNKSSELQILLNTYREDNANFREQIKEHTTQIEGLNKVISGLQMQLILFENAYYDDPLPRWLKGLDGTMLFVNEQYEKVFLTSRGLVASDYLGNTDYDVWDKEIADGFREHDLNVIRSKETWHGVEAIGTNGSTVHWYVIKFPYFSSRQVIGVAGVAIPPNYLNKYTRLMAKINDADKGEESH